MKLEPGDLVLVPFPFTNLSSVKTRPAFVLSTRAYNDASPDVIICGVTSNLAQATHTVLLSTKDLERGRLLADSRVKVDKVVAVHQSLVRKVVGRVRASVLERVLREFATLFPQLRAGAKRTPE
jgi:mRNA-degrading endonuclease toxin of MazEF toxin-antitoxin module